MTVDPPPVRPPARPCRCDAAGPGRVLSSSAVTAQTAPLTSPMRPANTACLDDERKTLRHA
jgi:hypothetical protein